jgi:hypothetical protein
MECVTQTREKKATRLINAVRLCSCSELYTAIEPLSHVVHAYPVWEATSSFIWKEQLSFIVLRKITTSLLFVDRLPSLYPVLYHPLFYSPRCMSSNISN